MQGLVLQLTRAGFLALLWLFVLAALRVVRSDLYAVSGLRVAMPARRGVSSARRGARQLVVTHGALAGTRIFQSKNRRHIDEWWLAAPSRVA